MQGMDTDQSVAVSLRAQKTRAAANRGTCEKQLQGGPQRDLDATTISDSPSVSSDAAVFAKDVMNAETL